MKYFILLIVLTGLIGCLSNEGTESLPQFWFSITNTEEYPDYEFYFVDSLWKDTLKSAEGEIELYKLATTITVYAVPKNPANFKDQTSLTKEIEKQSIKSQQIEISQGITKLKIVSFNETTKTMKLAEIIK